MVFLDSGAHFVYAMLCRDADGPLYVKFGRSSSIGQRLSSLRTACPIPARWFAVIDAKTKGRQGNLERELHRHFSDRKTNGEWYRFDADSVADRRLFNDGSRTCFASCGILGESWTKISVAALDAHAKEQRRRFMRATNGDAKGDDIRELRRYRLG